MTPQGIHNKRILISPLNWGMGHVSRCIGLIHELLQRGNEIVLACDTEQYAIMSAYFPEITHEQLDGYPFHFGGKGRFAFDFIRNWSELKGYIKKEHQICEALVIKHEIELVISDHRYGFFSEQKQSIFITHQYHLPVRGLQSIADKWHKKRMRPFQLIWLMDYADSRLSGSLTRGVEDKRVAFIGPYSRFAVYDNKAAKSEFRVVLVSGPLVYAQQFADTMISTYPEGLFICPKGVQLPKNMRRVQGSWLDQDAAILSAEYLISRAGYSTIMDLEFLQIPATLFPTKGQHEQKYLYTLLTKEGVYDPTKRGN